MDLPGLGETGAMTPENAQVKLMGSAAHGFESPIMKFVLERTKGIFWHLRWSQNKFTKYFIFSSYVCT